MRIDPATHYTAELGFSYEFDEGLGHGHGTSTPELCVPGTDFPHAAVLLAFADSINGVLAGMTTAPRVSVTVDFRVRIVRKHTIATEEAGRTFVVDDLEI